MLQATTNTLKMTATTALVNVTIQHGESADFDIYQVTLDRITGDAILHIEGFIVKIPAKPFSPTLGEAQIDIESSAMIIALQYFDSQE